MPHKHHHISGAVFLFFLAASFVMCGVFISSALAEVGSPGLNELAHGQWSPQFEKSLNKNLPVYDPSRNFWGRIEYALFHQGRKGVLIGDKGWLFTDEEFSCLPHAEHNLSENLAYIDKVQKTLALKNIRLAVVIVPEKARVLSSHLYETALPVCRQPLYGQIVSFLRADNIPATDLLSAMQSAPAPEKLYLRTDTHWSPAGAQLAALSVQNLVKSGMPGLSLTTASFTIKPAGIENYSGDLTRYVPGLKSDILPSDNLQTYTVSSVSESNSLLDDSATPQVALVGTSYSANPKWNFEGFLKTSLQADILNAADEGQGPFTVMDKYLASDMWKESTPALVIWELPERYFLMPHGVQS